MSRDIKYLPLAGLKGDLRNPKDHALDVIDASLTRFGVVEPVVLDGRTGMLVSGHGRTATLQTMEDRGDKPLDGVKVIKGAWHVPVVVGWSSENDDEAGAALIALNRTGEVGGWVDESLLELLDRLGDNIGGLGYDDAEIDALRVSLESLDDADPPDPWNDRTLRERPPAQTVERGHVYRVGAHLVACGDSRDPALWAALMGAQRVDMLLTDPPYGVDYDGGGGVERERLAGDSSPEEAAALLNGVLEAITPVVRPGAASYVFLSSGDAFPVMDGALHARSLHRWMLVWVKNNATFGRADYHQKAEPIIYGWFPGGARHPVANRSLTSVWEFDRPRASEIHPTEKPVELLAFAIENSTDPGEVVADPFGGSLTTALAAHRTGRASVSVEWEPDYVEAGLNRLAEEVGEEPVLLDMWGDELL